MTDERFNELADEWERSVGIYSGGFTRYAPAAELLAMGIDAMPLVMQRIRDGGAWPWFELACEITGGCPEIPEEDLGRLEPVQAAFIAWGIEHGWLGTE
jgi:hypothetical protein